MSDKPKETEEERIKRRSREAKGRYVKSQQQTRHHRCHWPGCQVQVPPAMWGCYKHWMKLPKKLRHKIFDAYRPGQEKDMRPSREYLDAAEEVQQWIRSRHPETIDGEDKKEEEITDADE